MLTIAVKAARRAGNVINRGARELDLLTVTTKGPKDFVSEVDREAERTIVETLLGAYPDHAILAEEGTAKGANADAENVWIIDPLDGTTNFLHGFPQYCVSIALAHRGQITHGVIYDPVRNDLFTATRGRGAFLNDRRIRVSKRQHLRDCLVGTGFPFRDGSYLDTYLRMMKAMIEQTAGLRRPGAAALDLAYVAAGFYDGFWEVGPQRVGRRGRQPADPGSGRAHRRSRRRRRFPARRPGDRRHAQDLRANGDGARAVSRRPRARAREEAGPSRLNTATEEPAMPRAVIRIFAAALVFACASSFAQEYPTKPIRIIVPFAAGGPADVYARFLGVRLQEALGQPVVVEDRPGAGSIIGTDAVAKSAPDGYTLLMMSNTHTVNETLIPNKPYQLMRDFVPIAAVNYSDLVLVVHPSVGANSVADLIRIAKASPGKLNYASSGPGTPYHMAGELFKAMAGVDIVHVPYKGSSGARTDVLGGQVQMMFDAVPTMSEHAKSGRVKALGTTGKARSSVLPGVPTIDEAGVTGYEAVIWLGLMAPKGTPGTIVNRLNAEITKIQNRTEVRQEWASQGALPMPMTPDEFGRYLDADVVKWERIVKVSGAKADQ